MENKFDPQVHTLRYFEIEWGIYKESLLYMRFADFLDGEDLRHALWVVKHTCGFCNNSGSSCQCEYDAW